MGNAINGLLKMNVQRALQECLVLQNNSGRMQSSSPSIHGSPVVPNIKEVTWDTPGRLLGHVLLSALGFQWVLLQEQLHLREGAVPQVDPLKMAGFPSLGH